MIQTLYFLLGMFIYYFIVSKRFRGYLKKVWQSWNPANANVKMTRELPLSPSGSPVLMSKLPVVPASRKVESRGGKLSVDETTLAEWQANLTRNGG
jgi:hypothetical protein